MKKLILLFVAILVANISFAQKQGSFSFGLSDLDVRKPLSSEANIGYFLTDDVMVSLSMDNWDNYAMSTRYYCCKDKFIQATTASNGSGEYTVGAAIGWTKSLGIWKLAFEPMFILDDIRDLDPRIGWALRFTL
tara:strand:+ start:315 stop:716 length:402 start_codon:yes stop_codon:yes gene_type:complete